MIKFFKICVSIGATLILSVISMRLYVKYNLQNISLNEALLFGIFLILLIERIDNILNDFQYYNESE